MRKITGYITLRRGDIIPDGAILHEVTVGSVETGFDDSVPMGYGAQHEYFNEYNFITTEEVTDAKS